MGLALLDGHEKRGAMTIPPPRRVERAEILSEIVCLLINGPASNNLIEMACHITGGVRLKHLEILKKVGIVRELSDKRWSLTADYWNGKVELGEVL